MRQKGAVNQSRLCVDRAHQRLEETGRKGTVVSDRARQKNKGRAGPALACLGAGRGPASSPLTSQAAWTPALPAQ